MSVNLNSEKIALFDPEQRAKVKVMLGIPNLGNIRTELVRYLLKEKQIHLIYMPIKKPNDVNANKIVGYFLEKTECTHL